MTQAHALHAAGSHSRAAALLETLNTELLECRRTIVHYARLTTRLELQLEQIAAEQQRAHRRAEELAAAIEREERRLIIMPRPQGHQLRVSRRPGARDEQVLEVLRRQHQTVASQVATALNTSSNYASKLLGDMVRRGLVERVTLGLYRAIDQTQQ